MLTLNPNIRGVGLAITPAAITTAVTLGTPHANTAYAILCTPNWDTTCYVTGKTIYGFTLNFGTAAPSDATVDWLIFR